MISARSANRAVITILRVARDIPILPITDRKNFSENVYNNDFICGIKRVLYLRPPQPPPPPILDDPRALADLDPQPPPLLPLKAEELLLSWLP